MSQLGCCCNLYPLLIAAALTICTHGMNSVTSFCRIAARHAASALIVFLRDIIAAYVLLHSKKLLDSLVDILRWGCSCQSWARCMGCWSAAGKSPGETWSPTPCCPMERRASGQAPRSTTGALAVLFIAYALEVCLATLLTETFCIV